MIENLEEKVVAESETAEEGCNMMNCLDYRIYAHYQVMLICIIVIC